VAASDVIVIDDYPGGFVGLILKPKKYFVATSYLFDVFQRNSEATYHKLQFVRRGMVVTGSGLIFRKPIRDPGGLLVARNRRNGTSIEKLAI
jgi:hypothetical protein